MLRMKLLWCSLQLNNFRKGSYHHGGSGNWRVLLSPGFAVSGKLATKNFTAWQQSFKLFVPWFVPNLKSGTLPLSRLQELFDWYIIWFGFRPGFHGYPEIKMVCFRAVKPPFLVCRWPQKQKLIGNIRRTTAASGKEMYGLFVVVVKHFKVEHR